MMNLLEINERIKPAPPVPDDRARDRTGSE